MANHDVAHAVADEVDLLDAVQVVDQMAKGSGVLGHVVPRAGVLDVEDLVAPFVVKKPAERVHRRPAATQPVQDDDRLAFHGRQVAILLDPLERREAFVVAARGIPQIVPVQQAAVLGEDVPLDAPLVEVELVGPELFAPQGGHWQRHRMVRRRFLADRAARGDGEFGRKHQADAQGAANHSPVPACATSAVMEELSRCQSGRVGPI